MNLEFSKEVLKAKEENKPIIALESTIISHGMPYPENLQTALTCEKIIRENNCCPATIAIINGKIKIGLEESELIDFAKEGTKTIKVSKRDLPIIVAKKLNGATTVATTMYLASLANIKFFATGGIGGVHRGAEKSFDISADLEEFSKTSLVVVSAGVKSILDLPKTMEYLETKGVLVIGYNTSFLPEFYTNSTNIKLNYRLDNPIDIASTFKIKNELKINSAILVCNPIPKQYEMDYNIINAAINKALKELDENNIKGKEATPYLLAKIKEITNGESLKSNIELVYNNVLLACKIAKSYYSL